jgi:hypothetical protein
MVIPPSFFYYTAFLPIQSILNILDLSPIRRHTFGEDRINPYRHGVNIDELGILGKAV